MKIHMEHVHDLKRNILLSFFTAISFVIFFSDIPHLKQAPIFIGIFVMFLATYYSFGWFTFFDSSTAKKTVGILLCLLVLFVLKEEFIFASESVNRNATCSMLHSTDDFDAWWSVNAYKFENITQDEFKRFPFYQGIGTFKQGRLRSKINGTIKVGDIAVYPRRYDGKLYNVSHRVKGSYLKNGNTFFRIIGDNNVWDEEIAETEIIGIHEEGGVKGKLLEAFFSFYFHDPCKIKSVLSDPDQFFCKGFVNRCLAFKKIEEAEKAKCYIPHSDLSHPQECCSLHPQQQDSCYYHFAVQLHNASLCGFINIVSEDYVNDNLSFGPRDDCYERIALVTRNDTYCKSIVDVSKKEFCVSFTSGS